MAESSPLRDPWLVAAWPGMGNVAVGAAGYLVVKLGAKLVYELPSRDLFEVPHIDVKHGLARAGRLPRNMFFEWRNPAPAARDLLVFIGEAQPPIGGYSLCHRILDYAQQRGAKTVLTFAAMASQLHPADKPRVFGVATEDPLLNQLKSLEVEVLKEGQISGLNGVLLAAGVDRGLPGACLLGELPYFAAGVPNPKASQAALEIFCTMSRIELDFAELEQQAKMVEKGLIELLKKMEEAAREQGGLPGQESFTVPEFAVAEDEDEEGGNGATDEPKPAEPKEPEIDYATRHRIDSLFQAAQQDRSKAFRLKQELDRLGVFKQYENRFLDLFRKGE
jgi:proteasome assembly chaperone (PAC2) family protein